MKTILPILFVVLVAFCSSAQLPPAIFEWEAPESMESAEKKIQAVEAKVDLSNARNQEDHELLTRIEERLIALQNEVRRGAK